jgi:hypothetical protein
MSQQNKPADRTTTLRNSKETQEKKEAPKTQEDIKAEAEKNQEKLNNIASVLLEYENTIKVIAKTIEGDLGKKFEKNASDLQRFRAELFTAKEISLEKSKELISKFEGIHKEISENLQELNSVAYSKEGIEARLRKARKESEQNKNIQISELREEKVVEVEENRAIVASPNNNSSEHNFSEDLLETTIIHPEETEDSYFNRPATEEILRTKTDLTDFINEVREKETKIEKQVEQENKTEAILNKVNADSEPKDAPRLIRQLWNLAHNKIGEVKSIMADSDNKNIIIENKDGSMKLVDPDKIIAFAGRSYNAFKEKYLNKIEDFKPKTEELNFTETKTSQSETRPSQSEKSFNADQYYKHLDPTRGVDILRGNTTEDHVS